MESCASVASRARSAIKPRVPLRGLRWLVPALGLALVFRHWVWMPVLLVGASMEPTLRNGQWAGVNKLAYRFRAPQRGDIVLVNTGSELTAKRILGLPREELALRGGALYVNGQPLTEPYVRRPSGDNIAAGQLGTNRFLVIGDNRQDTTVAVVKRERIVGPLIFWR